MEKSIMKNRKLSWQFSALICALMLMLSGVCGYASPAGNLVVYHAGSLTVPFKKMIEEFSAIYPDVRVMTKAGGSTAMARLISDGGEKADVMASADYKVIDNNLIPDFAEWNIRFASNQLVLCYTDKSRFASEVNKDNWYEILQRKDVRWGHSDPNLDPCGYRSLMVMQLAEKYYGVQNLYENLLDNRPQENVKAKAVQLVELLKSGELDYGWEYLSVAVQHGLKYVPLDDKINLGSYINDTFYSQAEVKVTGKKPGTWKVKKGQSVTYGVTMVKNSPNSEAAQAFLSFLLSPDNGLKILQDLGQPPFVPARVSSEEMRKLLPVPLASVVEVR
ncbi:MAG: tungstate ABC transporter substrate-binding protein WtpA [Desulforhopalus sp.]|nr:tungstate ABC transporter substrate-binding protein WtpA [Desulforhopalus sp.]